MRLCLDLGMRLYLDLGIRLYFDLCMKLYLNLGMRLYLNLDMRLYLNLGMRLYLKLGMRLLIYVHTWVSLLGSSMWWEMITMSGCSYGTLSTNLCMTIKYVPFSNPRSALINTITESGHYFQTKTTLVSNVYWTTTKSLLSYKYI